MQTVLVVLTTTVSKEEVVNLNAIVKVIRTKDER